jgi:amino acid adenylation domain-containing protein
MDAPTTHSEVTPMRGGEISVHSSSSVTIRNRSLTCVLIGRSSLLVHCGSVWEAQGNKVLLVISPQSTIQEWARHQNIPTATFEQFTEIMHHGSSKSKVGGVAEGKQPWRVDYIFSIFNHWLLDSRHLQSSYLRGEILNVHDGPLPRYAGTHAVPWALANGETRHGCSWHRMELEVDAGNLLTQQFTDITPDETTASLRIKMVAAAAASFERVMRLINELDINSVDGETRLPKLPSTPQEHDLFLYHTRRDILPANGLLPLWDRPMQSGFRGTYLSSLTHAAALERWVRAAEFAHDTNSWGQPKILVHLPGIAGSFLVAITKLTAIPLSDIQSSDDWPRIIPTDLLSHSSVQLAQCTSNGVSLTPQSFVIRLIDSYVHIHGMALVHAEGGCTELQSEEISALRDELISMPTSVNGPFSSFSRSLRKAEHAWLHHAAQQLGAFELQWIRRLESMIPTPMDSSMSHSYKSAFTSVQVELNRSPLTLISTTSMVDAHNQIIHALPRDDAGNVLLPGCDAPISEESLVQAALILTLQPDGLTDTSSSVLLPISAAALEKLNVEQLLLGLPDKDAQSSTNIPSAIALASATFSWFTPFKYPVNNTQMGSNFASSPSPRIKLIQLAQQLSSIGLGNGSAKDPCTFLLDIFWRHPPLRHAHGLLHMPGVWSARTWSSTTGPSLTQTQQGILTAEAIRCFPGSLLWVRNENEWELYSRQGDTVSPPLLRQMEALLQTLMHPAEEFPHTASVLSTSDMTDEIHTIGELFLHQVHLFSSEVAVRFGAHHLTYTQLMQKAVQVAHYSMTVLGIQPGSVIVHTLDRSISTLIGFIATQLMACSYCAIAPHEPPTRMQHMLADVQAAIIFTDLSHVDVLAATLGMGVHDESNPYGQVRLLPLDGPIFMNPDVKSLTDWEYPCISMDVAAMAHAYLTFTSGSTGTPKCVPISQRNLLAHVKSYTAPQSYYQHLYVPGQVYLASTAASFDVHILDHFLPLLTGGCVVILEESHRLSMEHVTSTIAAERVQFLIAAPSYLMQLVQHVERAQEWSRLACLKTVLCGGEAMPPALLRAWFTAGFHHSLPRIYNAYGPCECTLQCTLHECTVDDAEAESVPIGLPLAAYQIHVLDEQSQPVPKGSTGTLCIGGACVFDGYMEPEFGESAGPIARLNASVLMHMPGVGQQVYVTGDLVRHDLHGQLCFVGRQDEQVKLRGQRLELGEVAAVLSRHSAVEQAIVTKVNWQEQEYLCAYIRVGELMHISSDVSLHLRNELMSLCSDRLPAYMRPSFFILLNSFPLTQNGKVDRPKLPSPTQEQFMAQELRQQSLPSNNVFQHQPHRIDTSPNATPSSSSPSSTYVLLVSNVWMQLFPAAPKPIDVHADFLQMGGTSLLLISYLSALQVQLNGLMHSTGNSMNSFIVGIQHVLTHRSIAQMAAFLQHQLPCLSRSPAMRGINSTSSQSSSPKRERAQSVSLMTSPSSVCTNESVFETHSPLSISFNKKYSPPTSGRNSLSFGSRRSSISADGRLLPLSVNPRDIPSGAQPYSAMPPIHSPAAARQLRTIFMRNGSRSNNNTLQSTASTTRSPSATGITRTGMPSPTQPMIVHASHSPLAATASPLHSSPSYISTRSASPSRSISPLPCELGHGMGHSPSHHQCATSSVGAGSDVPNAFSLDAINPEYIAVIGMAGRFPNADSVQQLWSNLSANIDCIRHYSTEELLQAGVPVHVIGQSSYVRSYGRFGSDGKGDPYAFDATLFGFSVAEAAAIDPQHRWFLQACYDALIDAGIQPTIGCSTNSGNSARSDGTIKESSDPQLSVGLFAGVGESDCSEPLDRPSTPHTLSRSRAPSPILSPSTAPNINYGGNNCAVPPVSQAARYVQTLGSAKDFLCTRVAHKLGLHGPCVSVQTACSTSLVAVHLACQALLAGDCHVALAGGVSLRQLADGGYMYEPGIIHSPDGHCRPFDESSAGTVPGQGVGVVALKPLATALRDGDQVYGVILASSINNDGSSKMSFAAPSVEGQVACISAALTKAQISPASIGLVEAHGTGTATGDAIELAALTQAYRTHTDATGYCVLSSAKSHLGHLDAAAGVTGLIKALLCLKHHVLPPTLHFKRAHKHMGLEESPFTILNQAQQWATTTLNHSTPISNHTPLHQQTAASINSPPRRAAVTSLGMGSTNCHVILEEWPTIKSQSKTPLVFPYIFTLCSHRADSLMQMTRDALKFLRMHRKNYLIDNDSNSAVDAHGRYAKDELVERLSFTRHEATRGSAFPFRRSWVVESTDELITELDASLTAIEARTLSLPAGISNSLPAIVFSFPGQGSHFASLGLHAYKNIPLFRAHMRYAYELLQQRARLWARQDFTDSPTPLMGIAEAKKRLSARRLSNGIQSTHNPITPLGWNLPTNLISFCSELTAQSCYEDVDASVQALITHQDISTASVGSSGALISQLVMFLIQYSLACSLIEVGVEPSALVGHSLGSYAAATVAGVWSLGDAIAVVMWRAARMDSLPDGEMISVRAPIEHVEDAVRQVQGEQMDPTNAIDGHVSIAAVNSPIHSVLSGAGGALHRAQQLLSEHSSSSICKSLHVHHAFHSESVECMLVEFESFLRGFPCHPPAPNRPLVSCTTGLCIVDAPQPSDWVQHMRDTVQFHKALRTAVNVAVGLDTECMESGLHNFLQSPPALVVLEIGGGSASKTFLHASTVAMPVPTEANPSAPVPVSRCWLENARTSSLPLPPIHYLSLLPTFSERDRQMESKLFARALSDLFQMGLNIRWRRWYQPIDSSADVECIAPLCKLPLPPYTFQMRRIVAGAALARLKSHSSSHATLPFNSVSSARRHSAYDLPQQLIQIPSNTVGADHTTHMMDPLLASSRAPSGLAISPRRATMMGHPFSTTNSSRAPIPPSPPKPKQVEQQQLLSPPRTNSHGQAEPQSHQSSYSDDDRTTVSARRNLFASSQRRRTPPSPLIEEMSPLTPSIGLVHSLSGTPSSHQSSTLSDVLSSQVSTSVSRHIKDDSSIPIDEFINQLIPIVQRAFALTLMDESITADSDFYDKGGDSLQAIGALARIGKDMTPLLAKKGIREMDAAPIYKRLTNQILLQHRTSRKMATFLASICHGSPTSSAPPLTHAHSSSGDSQRVASLMLSSAVSDNQSLLGMTNQLYLSTPPAHSHSAFGLTGVPSNGNVSSTPSNIVKSAAAGLTGSAFMSPIVRMDDCFTLGVIDCACCSDCLVPLRMASVTEHMNASVSIQSGPPSPALSPNIRSGSPRTSVTTAPSTLFLVHAVGGDASVYDPLVVRIAPGTFAGAFAFQAREVDIECNGGIRKHSHEPISDLRRLALLYLTLLLQRMCIDVVHSHPSTSAIPLQLSPIVLGGHSFGGTVAFEMARLFEEMRTAAARCHSGRAHITWSANELGCASSISVLQSRVFVLPPLPRLALLDAPVLGALPDFLSVDHPADQLYTMVGATAGISPDEWARARMDANDDIELLRRWLADETGGRVSVTQRHMDTWRAHATALQTYNPVQSTTIAINQPLDGDAATLRLFVCELQRLSTRVASQLPSRGRASPQHQSQLESISPVRAPYPTSALFFRPQQSSTSICIPLNFHQPWMELIGGDIRFVRLEATHMDMCIMARERIARHFATFLLQA